tara:strand:+ start:317 stop:1660 length:1344 start_codon:yes stop_codon:yes gene_type:complete
MAVYYVKGISAAGATEGLGGYYYPLYLTPAEANASSSNTSGTNHAHTFYEFPGKWFYMPTTGAVHGAATAPTGSYGGENYSEFVNLGVNGIPYRPKPTSTNKFISLDRATCTGSYRTKPFRDNGDIRTNIYYHEMKVLTLAYTPLADDDTMTTATQKPLRSPFPDDAAAFYVGDQNVSDGGDGFTTFIRIFANIPETRYDPSGLYAFDFAGVTTTSDSTVTSTVNYQLNISLQGYNSNLTQYGGNNTNGGGQEYGTIPWKFGSSLGTGNIFAGAVSNASGLSVGDSLAVSFNQAIKPYNKYVYTPAQSAILVQASIMRINGNFVTFRFGELAYQDKEIWKWEDEASSAFFSKATVTNVVDTNEGEVETRNSPSRDLKSYIKSDSPTTETLENMTQLPITLSTTSVPTLAQYNQMVANGDYLNGAPETITRWMGNIYEKSLIQVRAIS